MGASYYQFCPVSKAMELLDERWTLLVLRELLVGSEHFNDLRRGLPRMSPSLLSKRLRQLVRAGIVDKRGDGAEVRYLLTPAGLELRPIIEALGAWGTRWIGELGDEDLDPQLLLWDMHRNIDHAATPGGRTVVQFQFPDLPARVRDWWLVIMPGEADVCDTDPGYPVTVTLTAALRHMTQVWRGDLSWPEALRTGAIQVHGSEDVRRAAPGWFTLSPFASVPRPGDKQSMELPARSPGQRRKDRHGNAPIRQPHGPIPDACAAGTSEPPAGGVDAGDRVLGGLLLRAASVEDGRPVAGPDVVSLPAERRRVVDLEEELEQVPVRDLARVEGDLDRLGMTWVVTVRRGVR